MVRKASSGAEGEACWWGVDGQVGETYDWRLSVPNMEKRDHYFTRLKWRIELTHQTNGEKARALLIL